MAYRLGVDVGGTFTDVLVLDEETGALTLEKVLSTPEDQSVGVLRGIRIAAETLGRPVGAIGVVLHGSTVVTNLILEEKGATGGLLTTRGNEQILHLARRGRRARCTAGWGWSSRGRSSSCGAPAPCPSGWTAMGRSCATPTRTRCAPRSASSSPRASTS